MRCTTYLWQWSRSSGLFILSLFIFIRLLIIINNQRPASKQAAVCVWPLWPWPCVLLCCVMCGGWWSGRWSSRVAFAQRHPASNFTPRQNTKHPPTHTSNARHTPTHSHAMSHQATHTDSWTSRWSFFSWFCFVCHTGAIAESRKLAPLTFEAFQDFLGVDFEVDAEF